MYRPSLSFDAVLLKEYPRALVLAHAEAQAGDHHVMVDAPEIPLILFRKIDNRLDTAVGQLGVFSSWFNRAPPALA